MPLAPDVLTRFLAKVEKTEMCWAWCGARHGKGYGHIRLNGAVAKAHRVAYELFVGSIPDGLTIDHLCGNTSCVNPCHLEAVPGKVNTLRGGNPMAVNARKTHCPQGHEYTPGNTLRTNQGRSRSCKACRADHQRHRRQRR
jgi:hypothetical protein